jgi:conjugative transposon TraN protein
MCGCCLLVSSFAQNLKISTNKTTSLIFPFPILHVDRGTKDVLVQQVKEKDNILLVKAACEKFEGTNLSVITGDGSVYSFRVNYSGSPSQLVWHIPEQNEVTPVTYCKSIADNKRTVHGIHDQSWDMLARVTGIYAKGNVIYCQLCLENKSNIDYTIELLKFYIRDKKKGKRTSVQENELTPVCMVGNTKVVKARTKVTIVVALDKFTIPDRKYFAVQILEKNGGRHLLLRVGNNKMVKAIPLPELR